MCDTNLNVEARRLLSIVQVEFNELIANFDSAAFVNIFWNACHVD